MTQDEKILNEIIQRRGYVVVGSRERYRVGDRLAPLTTYEDGIPVDTRAVFYVVGVTDFADRHEQAKLLRQIQAREVLDDSSCRDYYFYRALSD